jgi:hypothetical protein
VLLEGFARFSRFPQMDHDKRREIIGWLVRLYEGLQQRNMADEWRAKLSTTTMPSTPAAPPPGSGPNP